MEFGSICEVLRYAIFRHEWESEIEENLPGGINTISWYIELQIFHFDSFSRLIRIETIYEVISIFPTIISILNKIYATMDFWICFLCTSTGVYSKRWFCSIDISSMSQIQKFTSGVHIVILCPWYIVTTRIKCNKIPCHSFFPDICTDAFRDLTSCFCQFPLMIESTTRIGSREIDTHHHGYHHAKYSHGDHELDKSDSRCIIFYICHIGKCGYYFCQSVIIDFASYSRYPPLRFTITRASSTHHWFFQSFFTSTPFTVSGLTMI